MDVDPTASATGPAVPHTPPVWCPFCQAELVESMHDRVECPSCHREVDLPSARVASDQWAVTARASARYDELRAQAAELEVELAREHEWLLTSRHRWQEAQQHAAQVSAAAPGEVVPAPAYATASESPQQAAPTLAPAGAQVAPAGPHPAPAAPQVAVARPHVPMAVVLQGTGAVLLLAALVALSAVLWGSLPGWGQVAMLGGVVAVVGLLAVLTRKAIPTTSVVLAVLAAAALVVVLLAVPSLMPAWRSDLYPGLAALVFTGVTLGAGKVTGLRLWRLIGVASVPVTALLVVVSLLGATGGERDPAWGLAITCVLVAPVIAAMMLLARRTHGADRETSVTAWVTALVAASVLALVAVGALVNVTLAEAVQWWPGKVPWLLVVIAAIAVLAVARRVARDLTPVMFRPLGFAIAVAAGGVLAALCVVPAATAAAATAMGLGAVAVLAVLRWLRTRAGQMRFEWDAACAVFVALTLLVHFSNSMESIAYDYPVGLPAGYLQDRQWFWLSTTIVGIGFGAVAAAEGLVRRVWPLVVGGYGLAVLAWVFCWSWGEVGGTFEVVTVTAGVVGVGLLWGAQRRDLLTQVPWPAVVLAAAVPSVFAALEDPELDQTVTWWRVLGVATATGVAAVMATRRWPVVAVLGWVLWLLLPWWIYVVWAAPEADRVPEVVVVPTAVAVASVIAWWTEPRTAQAWWRVVRWPLLAAVAVSVLWTLLDPFGTPGLAAPVRVVLVVVAAGLVTVWRWHQPVVAAVAGSVGIVVAWWSVADALPQVPPAAVEWRSVPAAVALAAVMALVVRAFGGLDKTPLGSGLAMGLPAGLALVPSAVVAVGQLSDGAGLSVRFALVVAASALA